MKFKKIDIEHYPVIVDRLTRFEPAYIRYKRVFDDIISRYSGTCARKLSAADEIKFVEDIISYSLDLPPLKCFISDVMCALEEKYFKFNEISYQYLSARLNLKEILKKVAINDSLPKNVLWLKHLTGPRDDLVELRKTNKLLYPVEKILLCEGQTEKILLSTLLKLFNIDMDKTGILLIAAGGKNQVARKYYEMLEYTKLPFFILLDSDASETKKTIEAKLRKSDRIYILKNGEFEDLIPKRVLINAINMAHSSDFHCNINDFNNEISNVHNIENTYRKYGFGDFKKADFAKILNEYIIKYEKAQTFADSEIKNIAQILLN